MKEFYIYKIEKFMSKKRLPKLGCFRKNYNTQYSLNYMLETRKSTLDKGKHGCSFINLDILRGKLEAYGFSSSIIYV